MIEWGKTNKKRKKPYGFQQNPENSWTKPEPQNIPCRISEPLTSLVVLIRRTTRPRYAGNATNPQIVLNTPKKSHSTQATKKNTWQLFLPKKIPESKIANPQKTSIIPVTWDPEHPPGILPRSPPPISLSLCIHLSSVRLTKGLGKWEFHSSLTDSFWYAIYSLTVKQDRCLPKSFVIVFEKRFFSIFQETDCSCAVTNYRTDGPNVNFTFHSFS